MSATVKMVPIDSIQVPPGRRRLRGLDELMESIDTLGLLNPLTLTDGNRLVAGLHRLKCCEALGWEKVPATFVSLDELDTELAEIDENLIRNELTCLERAEHLARRKEIYLAKHPETKQGGLPGKAGGGKKAKEEIISSFADDTSAKAGVTPRTVRQEVHIAHAISRDVRDSIRGTAVEDKKTELLKLSKMGPERQREVATKIASGEAKGVRQAANLVDGEAIRREPPPLPEGPFRVIAADPPWAYANRPDDAAHRAGNPYPSMTSEQIRCYEVGGRRVPDIAHDDCILWLWTTNAHLRDAFGVVEAWGFEHKTILTWAKDAMGTGDWLRGKTEHCLMAVRGKPVVTLTNQTTLITGPLREHSRKPDAFYELVESLCPAPERGRVELFQREPREGWVGHGNQTGLFGA